MAARRTVLCLIGSYDLLIHQINLTSVSTPRHDPGHEGVYYGGLTPTSHHQGQRITEGGATRRLVTPSISHSLTVAPHAPWPTEHGHVHPFLPAGGPAFLPGVSAAGSSRARDGQPDLGECDPVDGGVELPVSAVSVRRSVVSRRRRDRGGAGVGRVGVAAAEPSDTGGRGEDLRGRDVGAAGHLRRLGRGPPPPFAVRAGRRALGFSAAMSSTGSAASLASSTSGWLLRAARRWRNGRIAGREVVRDRVSHRRNGS